MLKNLIKVSKINMSDKTFVSLTKNNLLEMHFSKEFKDFLQDPRFQELANAFLDYQNVLDLILFLDFNNIKRQNSTFSVNIVVLFDTYKKESVENEINRKLKEAFSNIDFKITGALQEELFSSSFSLRERVFFEGFSMQHNAFLCSLMGLLSFFLFKYSLSSLNNSQRMQFYYGLYGRNKEGGLIDKTGALKLSDSLILCPLVGKNDFEAFFKERGILYEASPILLPLSSFQNGFLKD